MYVRLCCQKKGKGGRASVRHLSIALLGKGKHEWDGVEGKRVEWGGDGGTEGLKQLKYMHPKYVRGGRNSS